MRSPLLQNFEPNGSCLHADRQTQTRPFRTDRQKVGRSTRSIYLSCTVVGSIKANPSRTSCLHNMIVNTATFKRMKSASTVNLVASLIKTAVIHGLMLTVQTHGKNKCFPREEHGIYLFVQSTHYCHVWPLINRNEAPPPLQCLSAKRIVVAHGKAKCCRFSEQLGSSCLLPVATNDGREAVN